MPPPSPPSSAATSDSLADAASAGAGEALPRPALARPGPAWASPDPPVGVSALMEVQRALPALGAPDLDDRAQRDHVRDARARYLVLQQVMTPHVAPPQSLPVLTQLRSE